MRIRVIETTSPFMWIHVAKQIVAGIKFNELLCDNTGQPKATSENEGLGEEVARE
jgi:hypothetical protein